MCKPLFVSDLDGTLLDSEARLSLETVRLLNQSIDRGVLFTVATARTPATVQPIMERVHMKLPGIVLTGAALWHFDTCEYSDVHFIDAAEVRTVATILELYGIVPFVYTLPQDSPGVLRVYYNDSTPGKVDAKFISQRSHLPLKRFCLGAQLPAGLLARTVLFFASGQTDTLQAAADKIRAVTACSVSCYADIYNPDTALIEVFAPGVSKAAAIRLLQQRYSTGKLTVFGDNDNDLAMFAIADTAVAVANALPEVKQAADVTIGPNTRDAVAIYISG